MDERAEVPQVNTLTSVRRAPAPSAASIRWLTLGIAIALAGCGGQLPQGRASKRPAFAVVAGASSGGLRVTLTAASARPAVGVDVVFVVRATERRAPGALAMQLVYGDGATEENAVPDLCRGGATSGKHATWRLSHRYSTRRTYTAAVTVSANCTPDRATAAVSISVR